MSYKHKYVTWLLFCFSNLVVSWVVMTGCKADLISKYRQSMYDVYIKNVMDTDAGILVARVHQTISFQCFITLVLCTAIGYFFRKYHPAKWLYKTSNILLFAMTLLALPKLIFLMIQISGEPLCNSSLYYFSIYFYLISCCVFSSISI